MSMQIDLSIRDIQEAQKDNLQRIAFMQPQGPLGQVVKKALAQAHRYIVSITHVITGAYRAAQRMEWDGGLEGRINVDPGARNPRSQTPPVEYSIYEEARGDGHDAYHRTVLEEGPNLVDQAFAEVVRGLYD